MTFQTRQTQNRVVEVYDFAGAINRSLDIVRSLSSGPMRAAEVGLTPGGTMNTTAQVPEGAAVDLMGGAYAVAAVPKTFSAYNGTWLVDGKGYPAPAKRVSHTLDGQLRNVMQIPGINLHVGGIMFRHTDAQLYTVVSYRPSHGPDPGMTMHLKVSEDRGGSWRQVATIYSHQPNNGPARRIRGACSFLRGDLMTVVISTSEIPTSEGGDPNWVQSVLTASYPFTDWTISDIPVPVGFSPSMILQGDLRPYPALAGGNDETGLICYAYSGGFVNALYTIDGITWSMSRVTLNSETELGSNLEVSIAQIGDLARWFGVIRPNAPASAAIQSQLATFVSSDMLTFDVVWPSGIPNRPETPGPGDGTVGSWSAAVYHKGRAGVHVFSREGWGFGADDQTLKIYEQTGSEVWSRGGDFDGVHPIVAAVLDERGVGGPLYTRDSYGNLICAFRTGETTYASSSPYYSGAQNSLGLIYEGLRLSTVSPGLVANPEATKNLFVNGDFHSWKLGTSWAPITVSTIGVGPDRWRTIPSGAEFTVSRFELPPDAREAMPHRPQYGMRIVSNDVPALNNSGFSQSFYGDDLARRYSRTRFVLTVWGYGQMPSPNITITTTYIGYTGGGAKNVVSVRRIVSQPNGVWTAEFTIDTPSVSGFALDGATQALRFALSRGNETSGAWDTVICGMFLHRGNYAGPCLPSDRDAEATIIQQYSRVIGASGDTSICTVTRPASTVQSMGVLVYPEMVRRPVVGFSTPVDSFTVLSSSGLITATDIRADRVRTNCARLIIDHESFAHSGGTLSVSGGGFITLDAEASF
jgi:hypothetical protein